MRKIVYYVVRGDIQPVYSSIIHFLREKAQMEGV